MSDSYTVYALVHPEDVKVRYVGLTGDLKARYQQHLRKAAWIQPLKAKNIAPILDILEDGVTLEVARKQEKYWIEKYTREGHPLENYIHNTEALSEREEERELVESLYERFSHLPEDQRHEMVQLTTQGYAHGGYEYWRMCQAVVHDVIEELEESGLLATTSPFNELDIVRLTAKIIGVGTGWRKI